MVLADLAYTMYQYAVVAHQMAAEGGGGGDHGGGCRISIVGWFASSWLIGVRYIGQSRTWYLFRLIVDVIA